jgi:hypothetical protein
MKNRWKMRTCFMGLFCMGLLLLCSLAFGQLGFEAVTEGGVLPQAQHLNCPGIDLADTAMVADIPLQEPLGYEGIQASTPDLQQCQVALSTDLQCRVTLSTDDRNLRENFENDDLARSRWQHPAEFPPPT